MTLYHPLKTLERRKIQFQQRRRNICATHRSKTPGAQQSVQDGNGGHLGVGPLSQGQRIRKEEGVAGKAVEKKLKTKVQSRLPFRTKQQLAGRHGQGSPSVLSLLLLFSYSSLGLQRQRVNTASRLTSCFYLPNASPNFHNFPRFPQISPRHLPVRLIASINPFAS